jgi:hypothetical protein
MIFCKKIIVSVDEVCSNKEQIHKSFMVKWCKQNNLDFEKKFGKFVKNV